MVTSTIYRVTANGFYTTSHKVNPFNRHKNPKDYS